MLRLTFRSLWEHKRRLTLTLVSIVLGVSFLVGTFVLSDTLDRVFDDLFAETNEKVDVQVQGKVVLESSFGGGDQRELLPSSLVDEVAATAGVRVAEPYVLALGFGSTNRVLDPDGDPLGASQGPPTLIESWIDGSELTPYVLADGRGPTSDDELALNVGAFEEADLSLGDTVSIITQFGEKDYELVGMVRFGSADSSAGAISAQVTLAEAQRIAGAKDQIQQVLAGADESVSQDELKASVQNSIGNVGEVLTGEEAAAQLSSDVQSGFAFFTIALQLFGGIALLVGIFVISNTFAIIVQQRTRELALLRAVGASRRQVLTSVILEALAVGLIGAVLGLGFGVLLAKAVTAALSAIGADLPSSGLVLSTNTIVTALLIGVIITLVSAVTPAIRATRVPPLAAMRDVAIDRSGASKARVVLGVLVTLLAALNLSAAWTGDGGSDLIPRVGLGAVLLIVASVVLGPILAGPSVRIAGRGIAAVSGVTGKLAVENAARSPKRTSATASALIIGVALVGFITVFAASASASIDKEVSRGFAGDFVVQSSSGFGIGGFPSSVADQVANTTGVAAVVPLAFTQASFTYPDGVTVSQFLTAIDPTQIEDVLEPRMVEGQIADLNDTGVFVDVELAEGHDVQVGDTITITLAGGAQLEQSVQGFTDDENLLGYFTITRDIYAANAAEVLDAQVYGTVEPGEDVATVLTRIEEAVSGTPSLEVLDRDGFIGSIVDQIAIFVNVVVGLLFLSIIIALIGVANTLSLSISERVRELGLLRAVGMDRQQLKRSIRWEAVIIALLGTVVGVSLAVFLAWAILQVLASSGLTVFVVPIGTMVALLVGGAVVGTVAAIFPARRAARMAILDAIATE